MRLSYYLTAVMKHETAFDFLKSNKHKQTLRFVRHVFFGGLGSSLRLSKSQMSLV
jgi:hypothetical protein